MAAFRRDDGHIVGETDRLRLVIDGDTGGIRHLQNLETGHVLVDGDAPAPWRITPQGAAMRGPFSPANRPPSYHLPGVHPERFEAAVAEDASEVALSWTTSAPGMTVAVTVRGGPDDAIELRPRLDVAEDALPPMDLTYPLLTAPRNLSEDGVHDVAVYPQHSGWLIRRPLEHAPLVAPYPDGYSGCSIQMMAYLEQAVGGFSLAAHDPHSTWKTLAFGAHEWSVTQETWDLRRGTPVEYDYPIVIAPLVRGDWHEAAERYRSWALGEAPWCSSEHVDGLPGVDRDERRWLHEEVGLALWGTSSSIDWSPWYRFYAEVAGTPLHICSGWDWPAERPHSVGYEGWFPARFHPANLQAWEGHHVTPYMNDLFISPSAEGFLERWEPNMVFPYSLFPWPLFSEVNPAWIQGEIPTPDPAVVSDIGYLMCAGTEAQAELHAWRDATLVGEHGVDGACYDISSGNPMLASRCWRTDHGHPPGRGRGLVDAHDRVNRRSKQATREQTGRYLVQGVETIIENVIGSVDFYVARAGAGPVGALEAWAPAPEEPPGVGRELIPLFEAVYHDVGPLRHDGWLTLADDNGDLFYWAASRIVLRWGGLLSLHYANNPPERPPGHDGPAELVNWDGATLRFDDLPSPDPGKTAFVRELARARTELATPYLGHGRLLRPLPLETDTVALRFHQRFPSMPSMENSGSWEVPEVVQGAWEAPDGTIGVVLVAVGDRSVTLSIKADTAALWGVEATAREVTARTLEGTRVAGTVSDDGTLDVDLALEPRTVTLLEISPETATHGA